ncbi:MAG TPA: Ig-like domain-containing protein, partial [Gaiellaceae bacterium]|nr:Ig-like domain-containing protein [Gaiellaceae bacterium]
MLQVSFVVFTIFAAGLVSAGVVSGAGPLAMLSTGTDTSAAESTTTETTTTTDESTTTESTETTTTETESSESTTTETSPVPSGPPTIASDKADYAPGETVVLTGENWYPGEVVHIRVNDDQGETWRRDVDVVAGPDGVITDSFALPTTFIAVYTVTATGPLSGTATTTFTDGNVRVRSNASGTTFTLTWTTYGTTNCSGPSTDSDTETNVGFSGGARFTKGAGNTESIKLEAAATATAPAGSSFTHWSADNGTDPFTVLTPSRIICVPGFSGSGTREYVANYAANTAPTANNVSDSTNEDTPKAITLSGSDAQQCELTFSIVSGPTNGTLGSISDNACTSGSPNTDTAGVIYMPNANFNGSDSFTYQVNDGLANSATATVSLTINPVNDAPGFTKGADQTVDEDAGAQSVAGWATAISAGPANESGQTLT